MRDYIRTEGPRCIENGWLICAVAPGAKFPGYAAWPRPLAAEDCGGKTGGVGILCGKGEIPVAGIDCDCEGDPELALALREEFVSAVPQLESAPYRVGRPPKFLLAARAKRDGWRKQSSPVYRKDGRKIQLEILGDGQQFVAYHVHPGTGKPYEWPESWSTGEPATLRAEDLPVIAYEDIRKLIEVFCRRAEEAGYARDAGTGHQTAEAADVSDAQLEAALTPAQKPIPGLSVARMEEIIRAIKPDFGPGSNDLWCRYGMAIHHQTQGSEEGFALWDRLSAEFPEAYDARAIRARWNSFRSDRAAALTFRWVLKQYRLRLGVAALDPSELGLANRFLAKYGDCVAHVPATGRNYFFDKDIASWVSGADGADAVMSDRFCRGVVEDALAAEASKADEDGLPETATALRKFQKRVFGAISNYTDRVLRHVMRQPELNLSAAAFDSDSRWFGVANGVIDLRTGQLAEERPEYYVLRRSRAPFLPGEECPLWRKTMLEWQGGDAAMVGYIQRLMGSFMTGRPSEDVLPIISGSGGNGKSAFLNVMRAAFGSYAMTIDQSTLVGMSRSAAGGPRSDIAKLQGARLVYCSETDENAPLKAADVKRLTGRDSFAARAPYGREEIEILPTWGMIVVTNHEPTVKEDDEGVWRRLKVIPFNQKYLGENRDTHLEQKLEAELPGILNWLLEGLMEYRAKGLMEPETVTERTKAYRAENDIVQLWVESCLVPDDKAALLGRDAYTSFVSYCTASGERFPLAKKAFIRSLTKKLPKFVRMAADRRYPGWRIRTSDDFEELS